MRKLLFNLLRILVSLILLAYLLAKAGLRETAGILRTADLRYFWLALLLYLSTVALRAYRWQILLKAQGVTSPLPRLISLYFIGALFNQVLPTGFGGDAVRIYELAQDETPTAISITTVIVDRLSGFLALFAMATATLLFTYRLVTLEVRIAIIALFLGSVLGTWLISHRGIWRRASQLPLLAPLMRRGGIQSLYHSIQAYSLRPFMGALAISLLFNLVMIFINYLVALSLGVRLAFWYFLLYVPIISFLMALPISLSGWGVREGGYVYLFTQAGVPSPQALAISLSIYALTLASGLIGGLFYALEGYKGMRASRPPR